MPDVSWGSSMPALVYRNTKHTIPRWVPFEKKETRGMAYENDTRFIHVFGRDHGLWTVSVGLTAKEKKSGTLRDWVERSFGATEIQETSIEPGQTIQGVWRPGLFFDDEIMQGLSNTEVDLRVDEQGLLLLIQRLDDLLLFVEPCLRNLGSYSHKARELLILACTEVENYWQHYMRLARVMPARGSTNNTADYFRLSAALFLEEYEITLGRYADVPSYRPFQGWSATAPTQSLPWYDAYNKTKHDRTTNFELATLEACIQSVAAVIALFSVRHGPYRLFNGGGALASLVNQSFSLCLRDCNPQAFYVPRITLPLDFRSNLICFNSKELIEPRIVLPLTL